MGCCKMQGLKTFGIPRVWVGLGVKQELDGLRIPRRDGVRVA